MKIGMTCFCTCILVFFAVSFLRETAEARVLDVLTGGETPTEQNSCSTAFFDLFKTLPDVGDTAFDGLSTVVDSTVQSALPAALDTTVDSLNAVVDSTSTVHTALPAVLYTAAGGLDTIVAPIVKSALPRTANNKGTDSGSTDSGSESPPETTLEHSEKVPDANVDDEEAEVQVEVKAGLQIDERPDRRTSPAIRVIETHFGGKAEIPPEVTAGVKPSSSADPIPILADSIPEGHNRNGSVLTGNRLNPNAGYPALRLKRDGDAAQHVWSNQAARQPKPDSPLHGQIRKIPSYPVVMAAAPGSSQPASSPSGAGGKSAHPWNQLEGILADSFNWLVGDQGIFARDTMLFIPNRAHEPPLQPPQNTLFLPFML